MLASSRIETKIADLLRPTIEDMGFDLVRVHLSGGGRRLLQVMAEPKDGRPMSLEDCSDLSRALSALLDVEDPIEGAYSLEISSPGTDRPLTRLQDFARFAGESAKIELETALEATIEGGAGRKRFTGRLLGLSEKGDAILLMAEGERLALPFAKILKAKLTPAKETPAKLGADAAPASPAPTLADKKKPHHRNPNPAPAKAFAKSRAPSQRG